MKKREATFQSKFNRWVENKWHGTAAFELKLTTGQSIPFNAVAEHQMLALLLAKTGRLVYKIPDLGVQNPFDSVCLEGISAYVVVQFWKAGEKKFYMVDAEVWKQEWLLSERKSLTEERAKEIGFSYALG
jgi:hypothetical protein